MEVEDDWVGEEALEEGREVGLEELPLCLEDAWVGEEALEDGLEEGLEELPLCLNVGVVGRDDREVWVRSLAPGVKLLRPGVLLRFPDLPLLEVLSNFEFWNRIKQFQFRKWTQVKYVTSWWQYNSSQNYNVNILDHILSQCKHMDHTEKIT